MFVIADSLVTPDKHNTGPINYNLRGVGCTPAAQSFARELGISELPKDAGPFGNSLRGQIPGTLFKSTIDNATIDIPPDSAGS
jgi:hypothetical protein